MSDIIRLRQRGQLTLPKTVRDQLHVGEGDFLKVVSYQGNQLVLRPARLVGYGSAEAEEVDREAERDIAAGRYRTFGTAAEVLEDLPRISRPSAGEIRERRSMDPLVDIVVEASGGDPQAALERWQSVHDELADQAQEESLIKEV